jgi:hypothetical protein
MTNYLARPEYFECGICGNLHKAGFRGDCRDDANRFTYADLDELPNGYELVEDESGEGRDLAATQFIRMLAEAVAESNGLVNDNTGELMTPESIRRTARHILGMDGTKESAA